MLLDTVLGNDRYPVNVRELALDYSRQKFPTDFIKDIKGDDLPGFEGALYGKRRDNQSRWLIMYNNQMYSSERINFTLAHEFGHYLLHREEKMTFECSKDDVQTFDDYAKREHEANLFAAQLLIPLHDLRQQVENNSLTFDLIDHCTNRYQVSLIALILKWMEITTKRAMIVVSRDGYILWSSSNKIAFESGAYIKNKGVPPVAVPENSLANKKQNFLSTKFECEHPEGVWFKNEPVTEMTIFSERFDLVITLLVFRNSYSSSFQQYDEKEDSEEHDTYEKFMNYNK